MIAFTNQTESSSRPVSVVILAVLTFFAVIPPMAEQVAERFTHNPLEVAFVYPPYPPRPIIDAFLNFLIDIPLLSVSIISGIGLVKHQRWAWFVALGLYFAVFSVHLAASVSIGYDTTGQGFVGSFDGSTGRYASLVISFVSLYLLSRREVRAYLLSQAKN